MADKFGKKLTPLSAFKEAKAAFEHKARNVTATDGIIDNGAVLEEELVGVFLVSYSS
jgi:hypothetical protein